MLKIVCNKTFRSYKLNTDSLKLLADTTTRFTSNSEKFRVELGNRLVLICDGDTVQ